MCSSRKYLYSPTEGIGIFWGMGWFYETKQLEFPARWGGVRKKNPFYVPCMTLCVTVLPLLIGEMGGGCRGLFTLNVFNIDSFLSEHRATSRQMCFWMFYHSSPSILVLICLHHFQNKVNMHVLNFGSLLNRGKDSRKTLIRTTKRWPDGRLLEMAGQQGFIYCLYTVYMPCLAGKTMLVTRLFRKRI